MFSNFVRERGYVAHWVSEYPSPDAPRARIAQQFAFKQRQAGLSPRLFVAWKTGSVPPSSFQPYENEASLDIPGSRVYFGQHIGIPTYLIECFSNEAHSLDEYESFARTYWTLQENNHFGNVAIVNAHDDMAFSLMTYSGDVSRRTRKVYIPYNPLLPGADHKILRGTNEISSFEEGVRHSSLTILWDEDFRRKLMDSTYGYLLEEEPYTKFFILTGQRFNTLSWDPTMDSQYCCSPEVARNLSMAYALSLFGRGFDFSTSILRSAEGIIDTTFVLNSSRSNRESRAPITTETLNLDPLTAKIQRSIVVKERFRDFEGFKGNFGGFIYLMTLGMSDPGYNRERTNIRALNSGMGERLGNICIAAGLSKGDVQLGLKKFTQIAIDQAAVIVKQLPQAGEGWSILCSTDNLLRAQRFLKIGLYKPLSEATQKIILFAQPVEVPIHQSDAHTINYLRELGVLGSDPETGDLSSFTEKPSDPEDKTHLDFKRVRQICDATGSNFVFKNTFYMAVKADIEERMVELYSQESMLSGDAIFNTYHLDWSKHFVEPSTLSEEDWIAKFDAQAGGEIKNGAIPNRTDWHTLWVIAQTLKKEANGIGVCDIGEKALWSDVGTIKELADKYLDLVSDTNQSSSRERRLVLRDICGIRREAIIENSTGITIADLSHSSRAPERALVLNSTFKNGGKISEGCVVIGSTFEEYVELPPNTIVVNSHIYRIGQTSAEGTKFLYNFNPGPENVTDLLPDIVFSTTYDHDGNATHLKSPIGADIKGKPLEFAFPQEDGPENFGLITSNEVKTSISATNCNKPVQ